ncbi:MAG TPA: tRNA (adenosine(37)-N6)-dimethylallyltransferase MiaA [Anaerolineales bacterium]|nr:tRNA (adenosine(37)-N6)-dimethylallyltransferase MiaA [Anaerolineales bacterium]
MKISDQEMPKAKVLVLVGPTAVGKTSFSIELALALNGEIISADSRYLYRGMDIGTAKPTLIERRGVPHHLIDVANPDEVWSLAKFQREVYRLIFEIHQRGKLAIIVGGTGQYIRAVTQGWTPPEIKPHSEIRKILEHWVMEINTSGLHQKLAILDPIAAENIDHRNLRRTIRALEVTLLSGRRFSDQRQSEDVFFQPIQIGLDLPREILYQKIDLRIETMFENGLIEEVKSLLNNGYANSLPSMSAIGYREVADFLEGNISLDDCVTLIKRSTRIFVRRQANWFKKEDPQIHWFDPRQQPPDRLIAIIKTYLENP